METKVNLALVGAFVVVLSLAIVAGMLWVSAGGGRGKNYDTYLAYSSESVSGLNRQAPVKYRGVEVGAVREIELDPEDPQRVRLVLAIERGVPIKQDTVAALSLQGLTGIAFLDLEGGSKDSPLLVPPAPGEYPVIATRPSLFRRLDTQLTALVEDLSHVAQRIDQLLDDDTRVALQRTIRSLDKIVEGIATRSDTIDAALVDAARTLENGARASEHLAELTQRLGRSAESVERAADRTTGAADAVRTTATDARALTTALARLAEELERNPNALVVGREPMRPGPGE